LLAEYTRTPTKTHDRQGQKDLFKDGGKRPVFCYENLIQDLHVLLPQTNTEIKRGFGSSERFASILYVPVKAQGSPNMHFLLETFI
jgi:hypothetical protein